MENEKDNRVERENTKDSRSYLDQYVGSPLRIDWGKEALNGTLERIDYVNNVAYFKPTIVPNPDGKSAYLETILPTILSLELLNTALMRVMIRPLRKGYLEEMVQAYQSTPANTHEVKSTSDKIPYKSSGRIGFGA